MDPHNPVVQLCVRGMQAEAEGRAGIAAETFLAAWASARNDYERCIAAHYVARHQATPLAALDWNARCLDLAEAVDDDRVRGFYPSLYLNLGKANEDLGRVAEARRCYALAEELFRTLPDDGYGAMLRAAVVRGLLRVGAVDDPALADGGPAEADIARD